MDYEQDQKVIRYLNRHPDDLNIFEIKALKDIKINEDDAKLKKIRQLLNELQIDTDDIENVLDLANLLDDLKIEYEAKCKYDKYYCIYNFKNIIKIVTTIDELTTELLKINRSDMCFIKLKAVFTMAKFRLFRKVHEIKNKKLN